MIGDRWGVSADEVARSYPCDEFVANPTLAAWRGVTVHAPVTQVWPWVVQIRWAPYSYDWVDNLGRRSPQQLIDGPPPQPGGPFSRAGGRPIGRLMAIDPEVHYTARVLGAYMSYVLVPVDDRATRLLLKIVMQGNRWLAPVLSVGDLVMARRQLLNLKALAEC